MAMIGCKPHSPPDSAVWLGLDRVIHAQDGIPLLGRTGTGLWRACTIALCLLSAPHEALGGKNSLRRKRSQDECHR